MEEVMLEIKNVTKTYRPKKGVPVKALDNVSLKFEDKGMVFILGKSGSGKSTLLNVLGGLDRADEGEFIIKGKSSNDFSQSDFDSYRNTFIGFIFQEYNILPEFTVGANIALAMELQGKKATTEALNEILEEVDLTGYGNRKPNELSGGQKQRVAIARALIKKPEMIMADEPTGALDSNTGKQVFDTLKKLSREKLVLVVSHDRDFAELYADRIIELKDGKIISDMSKVCEKAEDETVKDVKRGATSAKKSKAKKTDKTNEEKDKIKFTDTKPENVKLKTYGKEDCTLIRSRLPYRNSLKIAMSSLKAKPVRLIFTIFLCFVAFTLFGITDTMGSYNKVTTYEKSIMDSKVDNAAFVKGEYKVLDNGDGIIINTTLKDDDIDTINENSGVYVLPVYNGGYVQSVYTTLDFTSSLMNMDKVKNENGVEFYSATVSGFVEADEEQFAKTGLTLVPGSRLPQAKDEIVITEYIYEHFKHAGLTYTDPETGIKIRIAAKNMASPQDVLGKYINIRNQNLNKETIYKIVGVAETNLDNTKYPQFMPGAKQQNLGALEYVITDQMKTYLTYGFHSVCFVYSGVINDLIKEKYAMLHFPTFGIEGKVEFSREEETFNFDRVAMLSQFTEKDAIVWTDGEKTELDEDEILVPFSLSTDYKSGVNQGDRTISPETAEYLIAEFGLESIRNQVENYKIRNVFPYLNLWALEKYVNENGYPDTEEFRTMAKEYYIYQYNKDDNYVLTDDDYKQVYRLYLGVANFFISKTGKKYDGGYIKSDYGDAGYVLVRPYVKEIYKLEGVKSKLNDEGNMLFKTGNEEFEKKYKIVGYYLPTVEFYSYEAMGQIVIDYLSVDRLAVILSESYYNIFDAINPGYYSFAVCGIPYEDAAAVKKIVKFNYTAFDGDIYYELNNEVSFMLNNVNSLIEQLAKILLYVGIFFAVFASLMMYNFISVSISYKKREIGILRAVGARSSDVFGIFFNESLIITIINFILSSIATFVVAFVVNGVIRNQYGFTLTLLSVGIRQFALILGVGVLVAFIGSFLPVMRIARKRPIDAIQNR